MKGLAVSGGEPAIKTPLPTIKDSSGRLLGEEELILVKEVIDSGTLAYIYGTKVAGFEQRFAALYEAKHAVAVSSGTAALHTALIYLNPDAVNAADNHIIQGFFKCRLIDIMLVLTDSDGFRIDFHQFGKRIHQSSANRNSTADR